jgi:hypothetical protein
VRCLLQTIPVDGIVRRHLQHALHQVKAGDAREALLASAVRLGELVNYRSAGTVEYIYDAAQDAYSRTSIDAPCGACCRRSQSMASSAATCSMHSTGIVCSRHRTAHQLRCGCTPKIR